jgi:hypothetical protein
MMKKMQLSPMTRNLLMALAVGGIGYHLYQQYGKKAATALAGMMGMGRVDFTPMGAIQRDRLTEMTKRLTQPRMMPATKLPVGQTHNVKKASPMGSPSMYKDAFDCDYSEAAKMQTSYEVDPAEVMDNMTAEGQFSADETGDNPFMGDYLS